MVPPELGLAVVAQKGKGVSSGGSSSQRKQAQLGRREVQLALWLLWGIYFKKGSLPVLSQTVRASLRVGLWPALAVAIGGAGSHRPYPSFSAGCRYQGFGLVLG